MKRGLKHLSLIVIMMVFAVVMLSSCGPKKPEPGEAQAYVKAVLDLMCTGYYDHTVDLADIEEGKESETRDALVDQMISEIGDKENLSDEVVSSFRDLMMAALEKTKYTVGEAVETEDGYDVTVTIEPLQIFNGITKKIDAVLEKKVAAESDKILAMSEEEQTNYVMEILIDLLNKKVEKPKYDPPEEVVVHYGIIEDKTGVYGCTEAEGEKLGKKLFSDSGL